MPRWARFLSCSFTGVLLSLTGFFLVVSWWEGRPGFWQGVIGYLGTAMFWWLAAMFGLLTVVTLLAGRIAVNLYGLAGPAAGLIIGALPALFFATFIIAVHAGDWGGPAGALHRAWPAVGIFAVPFALSGGFINWLWERLD